MKRTLLLLLLVLSLSMIWGQQYLLNENFDGATWPPTGWSISGAVLSTSNPHSAPYSVQLSTNPTYYYIQTPLLSSPNSLSFWVGKSTAMVSYNVQISTDGVNFTTVYTGTAPNGWVQETVDLSAYTNIYVRFVNVDPQKNKLMLLDDVSVTSRTPIITLASNNPAVPASTEYAGNTLVPIYRYTLTATSAAALLTQLSFTTAGTYTSSDIVNFKLWYNTTDNLSGATQIGTLTTSLGAGTHTFTGLNQTIDMNTTGYFFITMDVAAYVIDNDTIYVNALVPADLTFAYGTATGTAYAGGTKVLLNGNVPVELSSFSAALTAQNYIMLEWVTQSETGVSGYYLFRNNANDLMTAERINAYIDATNTSQETSYVFTDREVNPGYTYYYWLQHIEMSGETEFHGPVSVIINQTQNYQPIIPINTLVSQVYPNPFFPRTTIAYSLAKSNVVELVVVNVKGEIVRRLVNGQKGAGSYRIMWDGRNDQGQPVASGVYFARMTAGVQVSSQKMILLK